MNYWGDDYVMGHLLRSARATRQRTIVIDLSSGQAAPDNLLTPPVRRSIKSYCAWFPKLVASHRTSLEFVRAARLSIDFDLSTSRPNSYDSQYLESPYICRVDIQDDRGKVWTAELRDWWHAEAGGWPPTTGPAAKSGILRIVVRLGQIIRSRWSAVRGLSPAAA